MRTVKPVEPIRPVRGIGASRCAAFPPSGNCACGLRSRGKRPRTDPSGRRPVHNPSLRRRSWPSIGRASRRRAQPITCISTSLPSVRAWPRASRDGASARLDAGNGSSLAAQLIECQSYSRLVAPDDVTGPVQAVAGNSESEMVRKPERGPDLDRSPRGREIAHRAWDRVAGELDCSSLENPGAPGPALLIAICRLHRTSHTTSSFPFRERTGREALERLCRDGPGGTQHARSEVLGSIA